MNGTPSSNYIDSLDQVLDGDTNDGKNQLETYLKELKEIVDDNDDQTATTADITDDEDSIWSEDDCDGNYTA